MAKKVRGRASLTTEEHVGILLGDLEGSLKGGNFFIDLDEQLTMGLRINKKCDDILRLIKTKRREAIS